MDATWFWKETAYSLYDDLMSMNIQFCFFSNILTFFNIFMFLRKQRRIILNSYSCFHKIKYLVEPSLALITCSYNISNPSQEYVRTKYLATSIYVSRLLSNLIDIIATLLSRYSVNRNSKMFYITRTTWTLNCSITSWCISETRSRKCTGNCAGFRNTVGGYRYSGQR